MTRQLLFSLTKKDFRIEYLRGSGNGGQKKNKTSSACRISHPESGAMGYAQDTRSQTQNRELAFLRMFNSAKFQSWYKIKCGKAALTEDQIQEQVRRMMQPDNLLVEVWDGQEWKEEDAVHP